MKKRCMQCMRELNESQICECGCDNTTVENPGRALPVENMLNGKYMVGKVIGEGGFGITYVAWDTLINTRVAIKEYFPSKLASRNTTVMGSDAVLEADKSLTLLSGELEKLQYKKGLDKFAEEASRLARFHQMPGVVSVKDFFYENNTAYMVMEYIEGETLKSYLEKKNGRTDVTEVLQMMEPVIRTLDEVHKQGVVHRDISPDNIMVTKDGQLKLIDFGAARFIDANDEKSLTVILKHGYAPEEQYRTDGNQGAWTDVYALCAVIYRMLFGEVPPEVAQRMTEKEDTIKTRLNSRSDIPVKVKNALLKGMAVKEEKRYQSMALLYSGLYGEKKNSWLSVGAVVAAAVILLGCFVLFGNKDKSVDEAETVAVEGESVAVAVVEEESIGETEETEVIEEPEYIRVLREYYNENLMQYAAKTYFVDLTGDGQDEMIAAYRSFDESTYTSNSTVAVYIEMGGECVLIYEDTMEYSFSHNRKEYLLTKNENGGFLWYKTDMDNNGTYEFQKIIIDEKSAFLDATVLDYEIFSKTANIRIIIQSTGYYEDNKNVIISKELMYEDILQTKRILTNIFENTFSGDQIILDFSVVNTGVEKITFVVSTTQEDSEFRGYSYEHMNVWCGKGEEFSHIEAINENGYEYNDSYVFQFGKVQHYAVETILPDSGAGLVQYKYCYENDEGKRIKNAPLLYFNDKGEVFARFDVFDDEAMNFYMDRVRTDVIGIFYKNSQYVQFGLEQESVDVLKEYDNWMELEIECKNRIKDFWEKWYGGFLIESIELKEIFYSSNGYFYFNYLINENAESVWTQVKLFENESLLEICDVICGKMHIQTGLDLPVYYGEGTSLVEPSRPEWELKEKIAETSNSNIVSTLYDDFDGNGKYELFAYTADVVYQEGDSGCAIWYSDGMQTKKVTDLEDGYYLDKSTALQFGNQKHFALSRTGILMAMGMRVTTCAVENEQPKVVLYEQNKELYSEQGKTYCSAFAHDAYHVYGSGRYYMDYRIFYKDEQYFEYGSKEISEADLQKYVNYERRLNEVIDAVNSAEFCAGMYINYPYVCIESVLCNSEEGDIIINLRHWVSKETKEKFDVMSEDEKYSVLFETYDIPCHPSYVILGVNGDELEIKQMDYGVRDTVGTGFPAIYPE